MVHRLDVNLCQILLVLPDRVFDEREHSCPVLSRLRTKYPPICNLFRSFFVDHTFFDIFYEHLVVLKGMLPYEVHLERFIQPSHETHGSIQKIQEIWEHITEKATDVYETVDSWSPEFFQWYRRQFRIPRSNPSLDLHSKIMEDLPYGLPSSLRCLKSPQHDPNAFRVAVILPQICLYRVFCNFNAPIRCGLGWNPVRVKLVDVSTGWKNLWRSHHVPSERWLDKLCIGTSQATFDLKTTIGIVS